MIGFIVFVTLTIEARIHINETPDSTYPSIWLDTALLDRERRERYGTEPSACWFTMVGQKPIPCETPETTEIKKGPPLDS